MALERWRVRRAIDRDEETGEEREIGGDIAKLPIAAVNGQLSDIQVLPVSLKDMENEWWDSQLVRFQMADRVVFMEEEEAACLIQLLQTALKVGLENADKRVSA